ncbi:MAG: ImmA/IrrE family metallo-endopeptidase [Cytophagales bacterium]|nr:ImmA/IrrE family metallo-endopeptidase [Cytophagales bacterium]
MSILSTHINPKVLKWARDNSGFTVEEISKRLSVKTERYVLWEEKGEDVPFGKLKIISSSYRRQIAVFFLKKVPEEHVEKPKDFRNLDEDTDLTRPVRLALRRSRYFQKLAKELNPHLEDKYDWVEGKKGLEMTSDFQVAGWVRKLLNIDTEKCLKWKSENEAYRFWRNAIEKELGILVFQFSMPLDEVHGYCLTDVKPFVIVTNSNHTYTARSFTLFHELAHIIRNDSGICFTDKLQDRNSEEWACNSLAGEILIPSNQIVRTENLNEISLYAKKFKVSREAYLRKLKEVNAISDSVFFRHLETIKSTYTKPKKGFAPMDVKTRASRGDTFYDLVLGAVRSNLISYSEGAQTLGVSVNQLAGEF